MFLPNITMHIHAIYRRDRMKVREPIWSEKKLTTTDERRRKADGSVSDKLRWLCQQRSEKRHQTWITSVVSFITVCLIVHNLTSFVESNTESVSKRRGDLTRIGIPIIKKREQFHVYKGDNYACQNGYHIARDAGCFYLPCNQLKWLQWFHMCYQYLDKLRYPY